MIFYIADKEDFFNGLLGAGDWGLVTAKAVTAGAGFGGREVSDE
jgi:hypothetical protein